MTAVATKARCAVCEAELPETVRYFKNGKPVCSQACAAKPAYLWVQEQGVNITRNCRIYEGEPYETACTTLGELYRRMAQEYGRCTGHVYIDMADRDKDGVQPVVDGKPKMKVKVIGWVFVKRAKYTDVDEYYLQETWVSVHTGPPTRTIEYHYADFPHRSGQ